MRLYLPRISSITRLGNFVAYAVVFCAGVGIMVNVGIVVAVVVVVVVVAVYGVMSVAVVAVTPPVVIIVLVVISKDSQSWTDQLRDRLMFRSMERCAV